MDIADLQAELRARTPWEAVDLGFALARRDLGLLARTWLALALPGQVLVFLLCWGHPWLAALLCWWLIPLWERVPLFVVSRSLFGVRPGVRDTLAGLRTVALSGLLGDLSLRRLSPLRTITLPVSQLERLSGARARRRRRALGREVYRTGLGVAAACWFVEVGLLLAGLVLVSWVLPDSPAWSLEVLIDELFEGVPWTAPLVAFTTLSLLAVVQPLRVGSLFGVYIQRRTVLEGWDVELGFRRLADRLRRRVGAAAVLLALLVGGSTAARADGPGVEEVGVEEVGVEEVGVEEVRAAAERALSGDEFGGTRTVTRWEPRWTAPERRPREPADIGGSVASAPIGAGLQVLLAVVAGIALVGLVLSFFSRRGPLASPAASAQPLPAPRQGLLALDGSSLPDSPAQAAWKLWQSGQKDLALSLLYRAAVAHLVSRHGLDIDDSATEGECLRVARRSLPGRPLAYLTKLTAAWQRRAYAHRGVDEAEMRALVEAWADLEVEGA